MAYNSPYQELSTQGLRHITGKDNVPAKKAFIDCLSMLQAMLLDISSSSVQTPLDNAAATAILEELVSNFPAMVYVEKSAYDTTSQSARQDEITEIRERIITATENNKKTALDLRKEYMHPSGPRTDANPKGGARSRDEVASYIEFFLSGLANQYENLRYPNTAAIPA